VTVMVVVVALPAWSRATAWMVFGPNANGTLAMEYVLFATCAAVPFTVTCALESLTVPGTMSFTIPVTETAPLVVIELLAGESMVRCGGVVSRVTFTLAVP